MRIVSKIALAAAVALAMALASASSPAQARSYVWRSHHHGWHHRHHRHHGYARATSDYYHRSRMLVGTR